MLVFSLPAHIARYEELSDKEFLDYRFISPAALRELGLREEIDAMLAVGKWGNLFAIQGVGYRELSLEFLSTFNLQEASDGSPESAVISFRINGRTSSMNATDFARHTGIYSEDDCTHFWPNRLRCELPQGITPQDAWTALIEASGIFRPRSAKATRIVSPAMRFMQHLVGHSIAARRLSNNVVSHFDILCLYSLLRREPIHLGILLARFLFQQATRRQSRGIGGTHYITRIAQNLGSLDRVRDLTPVSHGHPIDVPAMIAFRLCKYRQFPAGRKLVIITVTPGAGDDDFRPGENSGDAAEEESQEHHPGAQTLDVTPRSSRPSRPSVSGQNFAEDYPDVAARFSASLDRLDHFLASSSGPSRRTPRSPTPPAESDE